MWRKYISLPRLRKTFDYWQHQEQYHLLRKERLTYSQDGLHTFHSAAFLQEPRFREAYELGKAADGGILLRNRLEIHWRIYVLCWAATQVQQLPGAFVDCGVCGGMCARAVIHYLDFQKLHKPYYLLDTFTGLDARYSTAAEMEKNERLGYPRHTELYEKVKSTFHAFPFVTLIKGVVPETLPQVTAQQVCYLSIDMNCVMPEVSALEYFWPKLVPGGIIILDDYGYGNNQTQKWAHDTWASSKRIKILALPTGQGLIMKSQAGDNQEEAA